MPNRSRPPGSPDGATPLWSSALDALRSKLPAERVTSLARHARILCATASTLTLGIPVDHLTRWLTDGRIRTLDAVLAALTDDACELAVVPLPTAASPWPGLPLSTFIPSLTNREARDLASSVIRSPGHLANPLLLHGPRACGKSHLLRAIGCELAKKQPRDRVIQLGADAFSRQATAALRRNELPSFRSRLRSCAALLVDDLETVAGHQPSQEELARALDALLPARAQVVLTASSPSTQLQDLQTAVRRRLASGVGLRLHPPTRQTRLAIVSERITQWGAAACPETVPLIVSKLGQDLRHLDTLLTRLLTHPLCTKDLSNADLVRQLLTQGPRRVGQLPAQAVLSLVARHFNLRLTQLRSRARGAPITIPRQIAMYLLRRHCSLSYPEIGQRLQRHHTTALHACRRIEQERPWNASLQATLSLLEKELQRVAESGG